MESSLYNLNSSISLDDEMDTMQMLMHQNFPEFSAPQVNNSEINFQPQKFPEATTTNSTSTTTSLSIANSIVNVNTPSSMPCSTTISFSNNNNVAPNLLNSALSEKSNDSMREMLFRIASMQPIQQIEAECVKAPKRKNVKISKDPQSVAARHRRERISQRIRILQRLVPGGTKMDTASMLEEAIHYIKFLKSQVQSLERVANTNYYRLGFPVPMCSGNATSSNVTATSYFSLPKPYHDSQIQSAERFKDA